MKIAVLGNSLCACLRGQFPPPMEADIFAGSEGFGFFRELEARGSTVALREGADYRNEYVWKASSGSAAALDPAQFDAIITVGTFLAEPGHLIDDPVVWSVFHSPDHNAPPYRAMTSSLFDEIHQVVFQDTLYLQSILLEAGAEATDIFHVGVPFMRSDKQGHTWKFPWMIRDHWHSSAWDKMSADARNRFATIYQQSLKRFCAEQDLQVVPHPPESIVDHRWMSPRYSRQAVGTGSFWGTATLDGDLLHKNHEYGRLVVRETLDAIAESFQP